jgi:hypothetical protein
MKLEDKVNEAITYHLLPFYNTEVIKAKFGQEVFKVIDEMPRMLQMMYYGQQTTPLRDTKKLWRGYW